MKSGRYCYECQGRGYHMPGCPETPDEEEQEFDGDYGINEDDSPAEREYDYQADLDRRWEARERRCTQRK